MLARTLAILALLLTALAGSAPAAEPPAYTWEDTLDARKVDRLLVAYVKAAQASPSDVEVRLRAAQLCYYAWRLETKSNKRRVDIGKLLYRLGKEIVAANPDHPGGYLWAAASLAMIGLPRGILNSLQLVPEGKQLFEKSIALDPGYMNGMAYALMGHAYHVVPGFPLSIGDKGKAQAYLAKARQLDPNSTMTALFVADLFWDLGKRDEALEVLAAIPSMTPKTELEHFLFATNQKKAAEMAVLIRAGASRDPLYDVVSEIKPGIVD